MSKLQDQITALGYAYVRENTPEFREAQELERAGAVTIRHYSGTMYVVRKVRK